MTSHTMQDPIIVVEDDESMARLMEHCLKRAGFAVEHIADGRAALELVQRDTLPALIIIDFLMPYADGLKVTMRLREDAHWKRVPIICITGTSHDDTMIRGLRLRSDGFLTKPFRPEELVTLARRLIELSRNRAHGAATPDGEPDRA